MLTIVPTGLVLFTVGKVSSASFFLLLPAIWLTTAILGPAIATSDSGPVNFIAIVLASSILNVVFYAAAFYLFSKIPILVQRIRSAEPSRKV